MALADLVTQRWGVGSTILHLDAEALALGVLLFDRIVLPTPSDMAEADRWDSLGWDTEAQARRVVQLGELVHFAPWEASLRADWAKQWAMVKELGAASRDIAYWLTPKVIVEGAWADVTGSPQVRPVPVLWAPTLHAVVPDATGEAVAAPIGIPAGAAEPPPASPNDQYAQMSALHFRRVLAEPARTHPEATLDAALELAESAQFQEARRALYTAEALAAAGRLRPADFASRIETAVVAYNQVVADYAGATIRRVIHHVVPEIAGEIPPLQVVPGAGAATSWLVKRVLARLLPLPPPPQAGLDEGAALGMTVQAMAAVCG